MQASPATAGQPLSRCESVFTSDQEGASILVDLQKHWQKQGRTPKDIEIVVAKVSVSPSSFGAPKADIGAGAWATNESAKVLRAELLKAFINDRESNGQKSIVGFKLPDSMQFKAKAMIEKMTADVRELTQLNNGFIAEVLRYHVPVGRPTVRQVRADLERAVSRLSQKTRTKELTYKDLLQASAIYWTAMQIKSTNTLVNHPGDAAHFRWLDDEKEILMEAKIGLQQTIPVFYVPTFAEIDEVEITRSQAYLTYPLGLADRLLVADNLYRNSRAFAKHDKTHAESSFELFLRLHNRFEPLAPNQSKWIEHVFNQIDRVGDERQKIALRVLLFEIVHESGTPMSRDALLKQLDFDQRYIKVFLVRLQTHLADGHYSPNITSSLRGFIENPYAATYVSPFQNLRADIHLYEVASMLKAFACQLIAN